MSQPNPWLELFLDFSSKLTIDSKETGTGPLKLYTSQMRFLSEVCEGLNNGIHKFVNLKARQLGITTISLAIDLFWLSVHEGVQGALVTDTEANRNKFRIIIERYLQSLPSEYRITIKKSNRDNLVLSNGSVLDWLVAGKRKSSTDIGVSRAYNFLHATEVSNYGSYEGVVSLFATLAENNPDRLYIFESTAKGYNLFWNMWNEARVNSHSTRAFFIGWWANEQYSIAQTDPRFERFWDGMVNSQEQERINLVAERYNFHLKPEQIAWYRCKFETDVRDDKLMDQNYPWTEDDAFISTGNAFFPSRKIGSIIKRLDENPPPLQGYAYFMSESFMECKLQAVETAEEADLKIWEQPSPLGSYVMGIDPAFGRSELQDRSVIEIFRCYSDRLVQVAEYATAQPETYQVAWVMAHLAGVYKNIMLNLEVTGPGAAIMPELRHLRQLFDIGALPQPANGTISDLFGGARWFMYHRTDSPGPGYQYNWKTSGENKQTIMNQLRDAISIDILEVRSVHLAGELQTVIQDGFQIEASGKGKDDRVMASALAHRAWIDWVRPGMVDRNESFARAVVAEKERAEGKHENMVSFIVSDFFQGKESDREEAEIEEAWKNNMPVLFDYICLECGARINNYLKMSRDEPDPECEVCRIIAQKLPPNVNIKTNKSRAVDIAQKEVEAMGFTDMKDRLREGDVAAPNLAPHLQKAVDNYWNPGSMPAMSGFTLDKAAPHAQAAAAEGKNPLTLLQTAMKKQGITPNKIPHKAIIR